MKPVNNMRYRFNDRIIFDADNGTLSLRDVSDDPISISNPSRRLLLLLIAHQGVTISREVIFKKVWDDYGMVSSNNNLNQCISKLRRVIKALGIDDEVIFTVPKVGFMLRREIVVECFENAQEPFSANDNLSTAEKSLSAEIKPRSTVRQALPLRTLRYSWGVVVCVCIVLMGIAVSIFGPTSRQEIYLGKVSSCKVFISAAVLPSPNPELAEGIMNQLERQKVQCAEDEYLVLVRNHQVKSYISGVSRLFLLKCKVLREHKIEVCSGFENESALLS